MTEDGTIFVRRLLSERRQRAIGAIMQAAEKDLFPSASPAARQRFRTKVLESIGSYHDVALDCMKASVDDGTVARQDPEHILVALGQLLDDRGVGVTDGG